MKRFGKWCAYTLDTIDCYEYIFRNISKTVLMLSGSVVLIAVAYQIATGGNL